MQPDNQTLSAGGAKFDTGKPRMDLIAPEAMEALGHVLAYGAEKYEARNWEKGMRWGRVFASTLRHAWAWWRGEKNDPETGMPHTWHLLTNAMFLVAYEARGVGEDDRSLPKTGIFREKHRFWDNRPSMDQVIAECGCSQPVSCLNVGKCLAENT